MLFGHVIIKVVSTRFVIKKHVCPIAIEMAVARGGWTVWITSDSSTMLNISLSYAAKVVT